MSTVAKKWIETESTERPEAGELERGLEMRSSAALALPMDTAINEIRPIEAEWQPIDREQLSHLESAIQKMALEESVETEEPTLTLRYRGRVIHAQPINTRAFVRAMAPHLCMN